PVRRAVRRPRRPRADRAGTVRRPGVHRPRAVRRRTPGRTRTRRPARRRGTGRHHGSVPAGRRIHPRDRAPRRRLNRPPAETGVIVPAGRTLLYGRYMGVADAERRVVADLFDEVGPDAPTLCAGWQTRDLAAHLIVREHRLDAAPGILVKALAPRLDRIQR